MKLHPVQIPSFDEALHNWLAFKEAFESLIHQNPELPEAYKLQKLRSAVLPIHVGMVGNIYSGGYSELWHELTERFDNPKLLAETHVSRLLNIKPVQDESPKSILNLVDNVQETIRALRVMELPVQHWDALVVPLITSRLPHKTRQALCMACKPKEIPTLTSLLNYLQQRAHSLATEVVFPAEVPSTSGARRSKRSLNSRARQPATNETRVCVFCGQGHRSTACPTFTGLDVQKRLNAVREAGACFNCLRKGHNALECPSTRSCQTCQQRHNTLLCYKGNRPSTTQVPVDYSKKNHGPPELWEGGEEK